jgi:hypothetical protein
VPCAENIIFKALKGFFNPVAAFGRENHATAFHYEYEVFFVLFE